MADNKARFSPLDAKLHQGYDGAAEFKDQSQLLGSVSYGTALSPVASFAGSIAPAIPLFGAKPVPESRAQSFEGHASVDAVSAPRPQEQASQVSDSDASSAVDNSAAPTSAYFGTQAAVAAAPAVATGTAHARGGFAEHAGRHLHGQASHSQTTTTVMQGPGNSAGSATAPSSPSDGGGTGPITSPPVVSIPDVPGTPIITLPPGVPGGGTLPGDGGIPSLPGGNPPDDGIGVTVPGGGVTLPGGGTLPGDGGTPPVTGGNPPNGGIGIIVGGSGGGVTLPGGGTLPGNGGTPPVTGTNPPTDGGIGIIGGGSGGVTVPSGGATGLRVATALGAEHTAVPLSIHTALATTQGGDHLGVAITGIPAGAHLSAGIRSGSDGVWTVQAGELAGLTLTPSPQWSGTLNLNVTPISESGAHLGSFSLLPVTIGGSVMSSGLAVTARGQENSAIPLSITAALGDRAGAEGLAVTVIGLPHGALLSAGIAHSDGSWTLSAPQLYGLTLTPPAQWSGAFALHVTATAAAQTTPISVTLPVIVHGAGDIPTLSVTAATGLEDAAIPLHIHAGLLDGNGSEPLSVVVSGVPTGAYLSAGLYAGRGRWSLSASELHDLTITPPHNFSGTLALAVTAVTTEQEGNSTHVTIPLAVHVTGSAEVPRLAVEHVHSHLEAAVPLAIASALPSIHAAEIISVQVSGVPTGASLSAGIHHPDGSWSLTPEQLSGLRLLPAAANAGDFTLAVSATHRDGATTATEHATLAVSLAPVTHIPLVVASNVAGAINTPLPINLAGALHDTHGSESIRYVIHGIPDGFALTHGANNGDHSWVLSASELVGLRLVAPYNFEGQLTLSADAVVHAPGGDNVRTALLPFTVGIGNAAYGTQIDLAAAARVGSLTSVLAHDGGLLGTGGLTVAENSVVHLTDAPHLLSLVSGISAVTFSGLPSGASLSAGVHNADHSWTVNAAQLTNLDLQLPAHSERDFSLSMAATISTPHIGTTTLTLATTAVHVVGAAEAHVLNLASHGAEIEHAVSIPTGVTLDLQTPSGTETLSVSLHDGAHTLTPLAGSITSDSNGSISTAGISTMGLHAPTHFAGETTFIASASAIVSTHEGDRGALTSLSHLPIDQGVDGHAAASIAASLPTSSIVEAAVMVPQAVASDVAGFAHQPIALHLAGIFAESNAPASATSLVSLADSAHLSAGITNLAGSGWTLHATEQSGVALTATEHSANDLHLSFNSFMQGDHAFVGSPPVDANAHLAAHESGWVGATETAATATANVQATADAGIHGTAHASVLADASAHVAAVPSHDLEHTFHTALTG